MQARPTGDMDITRVAHEATLGDSGVCVAGRPSLLPIDVWTFLKAGCNTREIATYAQVTMPIARAMCAEAMREARRQ